MVLKKIVSLFLFLAVSLQGKALLFSEFKERIFKHEQSRVLDGRDIFELFEEYQKMITEDFGDEVWVDKKPESDFFEFNVFYPFAQKKKIELGAETFVFGDIHGDIESLIKALETLKEEGFLDDDFKIKKPCYFIFLGDYVDRGFGGIEVVYAIVRLKCQNPDQVVILRGNHEDAAMNRTGGFTEELEYKYGCLAPFVFKLLYSFYETLPCALLWESGNNALFCCHGGIELGVDLLPLLSSDKNHCYQLITEVDRMQRTSSDSTVHALLKKECLPLYLEPFTAPLDSTSSHLLGFLWNDFSMDSETFIIFDVRRGLECGSGLVDYYLGKLNVGKKKVRAILRGHQHGNMFGHLVENGGVVSMYGEKVFTLLASSDFLEPDDEEEYFSSFFRIKTAPSYDDWEFKQWTKYLKETSPSFLSRIISYFYAQTLGRMPNLLGR